MYIKSLLLAALVSVQHIAGHVTANPGTAVEATYFATVFRVPHGCDNSSTVQVTLNYDEELVKAGASFTPQNVPGWKATIAKVPGSENAGGHNSEVGSGGASTGVTYSDGDLPPDMYGDFGLSFKLPALSSLPADRNGTLYFPVNQLCKNGKWQNWTTPGDTMFPPPQVKVTSAKSQKSDAFTHAISIPVFVTSIILAYFH